MENVDPVSGNEIPPGSLPEEVRDNVDIKASPGEYMLPADVVKYFGLDYIEKLINKAKTGMAELQAAGRIGGSDGEELPFSPEELQAHEEELTEPQDNPQEEAQEPVPKMATGGLIPRPKDAIAPLGTPTNTIYQTTTESPSFDQSVPVWMQDQQKTSQNDHWGDGEDKKTTPATGFARQVKEWGVKDYSDYADSRDSVGRGVAVKMASSVSPVIGLAIKGLSRLTDKNAVTHADQMIQSGMDQMGNPLSEEDKANLQKARDRIATKKENTSLLGSVTGGGVGGLISRLLDKATTKKDSTKTDKETKSANSGSKSTDKDKTPEQKLQDEKDKKKRESYSKQKMSKGGLIVRK